MPHPEEDVEFDIDAELRGLFQQAEQVLENRAAATRRTDVHSEPHETSPISEIEPPAPAPEPLRETISPPPAYSSLPQMLRPVVQGLEAISRATGESSMILGRLDKASNAAAEAQHTLPQIVTDLRGMIDQKTGLNQRMFDALHEELRGYKDGFLLDSVHRPIIRDLISLYDDLAQIHRQMQDAVVEHRGAQDPAASTRALLERMRTLDMNIEHNLGFILEVLARLEVTPMDAGTGTLDKRTQRAVAVELAEDRDDDNAVARTVKCGFLWKERVVRAEEVVIKKWKEGFLVAIPAEEVAGSEK